MEQKKLRVLSLKLESRGWNEQWHENNNCGFVFSKGEAVIHKQTPQRYYIDLHTGGAPHLRLLYECREYINREECGIVKFNTHNFSARVWYIEEYREEEFVVELMHTMRAFVKHRLEVAENMRQAWERIVTYTKESLMVDLSAALKIPQAGAGGL